MKAQQITRFGILGAAALVLGYVETLLPLSFTIPGIKLGLSNAVLLYALYTVSFKEAWLLMAIKVCLSGFLFAGLSGLLYSLSGGILSLCAMFLAKKVNLSILGVSVLGAVFHNTGQALVACFAVNPRSVLAIFPYLLIAAVVTGLLVGVCTKAVIRYTNKLG